MAKDHHGMPRVKTKPTLAKKGVAEARKQTKPVERKTGGTKGRGRFAGMC